LRDNFIKKLHLKVKIKGDVVIDKLEEVVNGYDIHFEYLHQKNWLDTVHYVTKEDENCLYYNINQNDFS